MLFDYVGMTQIRVTTTYGTTNFKYVICIDSSTCIAADDSTTGFKYYVMKNTDFLGGTLDALNTYSITDASAGATTGLVARQTIQKLYVSRGSKVYVVILSSNEASRIFEIGSAILGLKVSTILQGTN